MKIVVVDFEFVFIVVGRCFVVFASFLDDSVVAYRGAVAFFVIESFGPIGQGEVEVDVGQRLSLYMGLTLYDIASS